MDCPATLLCCENWRHCAVLPRQTTHCSLLSFDRKSVSLTRDLFLVFASPLEMLNIIFQPRTHRVPEQHGGRSK